MIMTMACRVEMWRGSYCPGMLDGRSLRSAVPRQLCRSPRFHIPLIEPDRRISRIRLSDKMSHVRPRKAAGSCRQMNQPQPLMEILVRVA